MSVETGLVGFAHALRGAGLVVTADRTAGFVDAVTRLGLAEAADVYWAGRATMTSGPDDAEVYDRVFRAWFTGEQVRRRAGHDAPPAPTLQAALSQQERAGDAAEEGETLRVQSSGEDVLRHRDVADLTAAERRALAELFAGMRVRLPVRRGHRRRPAARGQVHPRRTVREMLRRGGELAPPRYRARTPRPRTVVLLIDVSGSMQPYADTLLRLAHRVVRAGASSGGRVEVFTVGTRLTRLTPALRAHADPDTAMAAAGAVVPDWSGGTRLGEVLKAFADRWGQRGLARGAVVVICSDGWERGDPALLAEQVRRLQRLAHKVVWANPHRGRDGYQPVQQGVVAVLPWLDSFVAGHSMAAYAALMEEVARA